MKKLIKTPLASLLVLGVLFSGNINADEGDANAAAQAWYELKLQMFIQSLSSGAEPPKVQTQDLSGGVQPPKAVGSGAESPQ